jgi:hypothetical protein
MTAYGNELLPLRVDYGLSFIPNADAHRYVCYRGTPPSQCGHEWTLGNELQSGLTGQCS